MIDDEAWMTRFIKEYDSMQDPELRAELLMRHGIHPELLSSWRRRLARNRQTPATTQETTPSVSPQRRIRRTSRATRRPTTPRSAAGGSRTYQITLKRIIRRSRRTTTVVTKTVTTITTITTTAS
ncbi:hypothetical protein OG851_33905 [Streptomyces sp. NBC_00161]|uniref:hypothetical protein n=1 Tax=Streptomyces sp. NBC_00161 TaxID=2975671 RepID=UPI00324E5CBB